MSMPFSQQKIDGIKQIVFSYFNIDPDDFPNPPNTRWAIKVQRIIWFLAHQQVPDMALQKIDELTFNCNYVHGALSTGIKTISCDIDLIEINRKYFSK